MLQLYDKIEEINNADQTCVKRELGQCSQAVKDVCDQTHCLKTFLNFVFISTAISSQSKLLFMSINV